MKGKALNSAAAVLLVVPADEDAVGGQARYGYLIYRKLEGNRPISLAKIPRTGKSGRFKRWIARPLLFARYLHKLAKRHVRAVHIFVPCERLAFYEKTGMLLLGVIFGKKVIFNFRNDCVRFYEKMPCVEQHLFRFLLGRSHCLLFQSQHAAGYFGKLFPKAGQPRLQVMYNGIDLTEIGTQEAKKAENDSGITQILFLGHVCKRKGVDTLLKIAGRLCEDRVNFRMHVCGFITNGRFFDEIQQEVQSQGLGEHVIFHGHLAGEAKDNFLREADFFILPSRAEGFSNAMLEAMAWGLPVIVTNVGVNPEVIENGINGFVVESEDVEGYVKCIRFLTDSPEERLRIGSNNQKKIVGGFSVDSKIAELNQLYDEMTVGN